MRWRQLPIPPVMAMAVAMLARMKRAGELAASTALVVDAEVVEIAAPRLNPVHPIQTSLQRDTSGTDTR